MYIKLETSDGEVRWINLDRVRRVTLAEETVGGPLMVIVFDEGDASDEVRIHGSDDQNRQVIQKVISRLDELAS
jgi:hypothetical protein